MIGIQEKVLLSNKMIAYLFSYITDRVKHIINKTKNKLYITYFEIDRIYSIFNKMQILWRRI